MKSANDKMKVEHKKKERIKQIAADRRTAQKFFLIQVQLDSEPTTRKLDSELTTRKQNKHFL